MPAEARVRCLRGDEAAALLRGDAAGVPARRRARHALRCDACAAMLAAAAPPAGDECALEREAERPLADRFRVTEQLVASGSSAVYLADDLFGAGRARIELWRADAVPVDDPAIATGRLLAGACLLRSVEHRALMPVRSVGTLASGVFVALQLERGRSLRRWQREAVPSAARLLRVYAELAWGLAAAHSAGLVHRRLTPERCWMGELGQVWLAGFDLLAMAGGLPEALGGDHPPGAPEQVAGRPGRRRCDQFALCSALAEALVGSSVPAGVSMDALGELVAQARDEPVADDALRAVARGLRPRPIDRLASAVDLAEALEAARVGALPPRSGGRAPRGWLVGGAALLAVALLAAAMASRRPGVAHGDAPGGERAPPGAALSSEGLEPLQPAPMMPLEPAMPIDAPRLAARPALLFDDRTPAGRAARRADERQRAGDGAGCLGWLRRVQQLDRKRAARADLQGLRARCLMLAGRCEQGRRAYAATLSKTGPKRSAEQLERLLDARSPTACKSPRGQARERASELYLQASKAAGASSLSRCQRLGADLAELVKREHAADDPALRASLHRSLRVITGCLIERASCRKARAAWKRAYRLLFPDQLDDQQWAERAERIFAAQYPRCRI